MPDMTFSNPQGQQITVNSPDGSTPSEGELDQLFSQAHGSSENQEEPEKFSDLPNNTPTSNPNITSNPITNISGDLTRGFLNSGAGTVDKINGAVKLLKNITNLDIGSQGLSNVSNALRQTASQQPQSSNPIVSGVGQFIGSVPDALAEFAGTGGGVGFIARNAALSAADAYNKTQSPADLIKGAAIGGTVGAVVNKIPDLIDSASILAKKWGQTAGKTYFQKVTGATNDEAEQFMNNINDININPKDEVEDYNDAKARSAQEVSSLRETNNDLIAKQKEQSNEEYQMAREQSSKALQDVARSNDSTIDDLKDTQTQDKINIVRSNSNNLMAATDASTQRLADATANQISNIANAKNALSAELTSTFATAAKKLDAMQKGVTDNVAMANASLEKNGLDYVPTQIIKNELDSAIGTGVGRYFKNRGVPDREVAPGVKISDLPPDQQAKFGQGITAAPGTATGAVSKAVDLINETRSALVDEFAKTGKTSLSAIEAQSTALENAISKGFNGQSLPKNLVSTMSKIKSAITLTKNSVDEEGNKIPGLYDRHPAELSHLKPLADANKAYSSQIDGMRNALDLYKDNVDGSINPDKVFKALDSGDTGYIAKLKQADEALPKEDRIFNKVKQSYDNFKFVENSEKSSLSKIQKQVSENRNALKSKFDDMEQKLTINQRKQMSEIRTGNSYAERDLANQQRKQLSDLHYSQKQALNLMKAQKDKELDTLQKSLNDRLKFLHIQSMARGERANPSGSMRIVQNVGEYHSISGMMALDPKAILQGLVIKRFASPRGVSSLVKKAVNAPESSQNLKKLAGNKALKAILATKASGR